MPYVPGLGVHLSRPATDCQAAGVQNLFDITGGAILMTYLLLRVRVEIGNDAMGTLLLRHDEEPTGITTDFCTAVAIDTDIAGTLYDCDGDPANALRVHTYGSAGAGTGLVWPGGWIGGDMATDIIGTGWLLGPGHIQWFIAVGAHGDDGTISVELFYIPLEEGVAVTLSA